MLCRLGGLVTVLVLVHLGTSPLAAQARERVPAAPPAAPLPMPQAWDTSFVMLLEANPAYRPASAEAGQAVLQQHLQYQLRLIAEGHTLKGGPLVQQEGASLVGMTVLRAASLAEARRITEADPAVSAGLFQATVRTWTTPAGGTGRAAAPASARDSVIATVQEFFRAMAANDVEASRRVLLPEGVRFSTLETPEGPRLRREANEAYFTRLAQNDDALFEHIWGMTAHVQGAIAMVWAPYDFYVNGEFSHCGTNAISLIRTGEGWQIASSAWTIELEGCEPSPLGPLREDQR